MVKTYLVCQARGSAGFFRHPGRMQAMVGRSRISTEYGDWYNTTGTMYGDWDRYHNMVPYYGVPYRI